MAVKYKVALVSTQEGYSVYCPDLPSCWSLGKSEQEAPDNIHDAIEEYLAVVGRRPDDRGF